MAAAVYAVIGVGGSGITHYLSQAIHHYMLPAMAALAFNVEYEFNDIDLVGLYDPIDQRDQPNRDGHHRRLR